MESPKNKKKINKKKLMIYAVFLAMLFSIFLLTAYGFHNKGRLPKFTYVDNIDVSFMTYEEASEKILSLKPKEFLQNSFINMKYEDNTVTKALSDFNAEYHIDKALKEINRISRERTFLKTISLLFIKEKPKYSIPISFSYSKEVIGELSKEVSNKYNKLPVDAVLKKKGSSFEIEKEVSGVNIKEQELKDKIIKAVESFTGSSPLNIEILIPFEITNALITEEILKDSHSLIAEFKTSLSPTGNRTSNIITAAAAVNGTYLKPQEVFSLNKALGSRTAAKGYKSAPVFSNGTVSTAIAGGICQLATTLYNTALLSNMDIVERKPHSLTVGYVPPSLDATISGNNPDFKFKNNKETPIYIESYVSEGSLYVNFYGKKDEGPYTYKFTSSIISQKGGYLKSRAYKHTYENGKLIKTEILSTDTYKIH